VEIIKNFKQVIQFFSINKQLLYLCTRFTFAF